jgi:penicillin amidase
MRIVASIVTLIITIGLIAALDTKIGGTPPLGRLLSPSHGFWKNAEPSDYSFSADIKSPLLEGEVNVYMDDRLVPHVFAQNDHDAYFVQGWLHARFRLWQMEFQTHAAAGRLSEILGEKVGENSVLEKHDRKFRRLGMTYGAENSLKAMQKNDSQTFEALQAYTDGANAYINTLTPDNYPIEYKLLDYAPEPWTPLKSVLFLKYMSFDLANDDDDFRFTNLLQKVGIASFEKMFPIVPDSLSAILPKGTAITSSTKDTVKPKHFWLAKPASFKKPVPPADIDSLYLTDTVSANGIAYELPHTDPDNGSNNWVVDSSKTASKKPILCNDPHLGLGLPSLWYEIQLHTPEYNVYGVSFPGAPSVIIGFNDSIAWGVTNAMRDVMDFYEVRFRDSTMNEYWYDSAWHKTEWRTEAIRIRGKADFSDKIPMTVWGPVMFDGTYQSDFKNGKAYAIRWKAHDAGNSFELNTFFGLNRAKNYTDYENAIKQYACPGQNFVFAAKTGDIAWWQQASFPAKWRRQGDFVMPGWQTDYRWQFDITQANNLHMLNPARGFVSSANQLPTGDTLAYPYYIGGIHDVYRGIIINRYLNQMNAITVQDMMKMQTDNFNVFAEMARPVLLQNIDSAALTAEAKEMLQLFADWNLRADINEKGQTIFVNWWAAFADTVWNDDIVRADGLPVPFPAKSTLLEGILRDSSFAFIDNLRTPEKETLPTMVTAALNKAASNLKKLPSLEWAKYKDTRVNHLLSLRPFSSDHLLIGGGSDIINATKGGHGPSWRMVVHLTDETEAYGVYPGGQNGNPGSQYYDQFVQTWVSGQYHRLWIMKTGDEANEKVTSNIRFIKG